MPTGAASRRAVPALLSRLPGLGLCTWLCTWLFSSAWTQPTALVTSVGCVQGQRVPPP